MFGGEVPQIGLARPALAAFTFCMKRITLACESNNSHTTKRLTYKSTTGDYPLVGFCLETSFTH